MSILLCFGAQFLLLFYLNYFFFWLNCLNWVNFANIVNLADLFSLCMKLIKSGEIDAALGKLHEWYPQIVQVDSTFSVLIFIDIHYC